MGWPQPRSTLAEDCLTLNVYAGPAAAHARPAPVLFWIYGGGFQGGGGNETRLNGTWDAALMRGELIVVTSNYRLNAFGFAASEALSSRESAIARERRGTGNYGILDQRAAMRWVRENIRGFGGDPTRVFIVGQSAGADSVSQHLVRRASWPYFSAAGMESGAFYEGFAYPTVASKAATWAAFVRAAGCGESADRAECMVRLPADAIVNLTRGVPEWDGAWLGPVVDGVELAAQPPHLAMSGEIARVPVLAGGVEEDISTFASSCALDACTRNDFVSAAVQYGFRRDEAADLADMYARDPTRPGQGPLQRWHAAIAHAGADAWSNCAARRVVQWASHGGVPTRGDTSATTAAWWYKWSYVPAGPNGRGLSHHSVEQPFIFHVLSESAEEAKEDSGKYHISGAAEAAFSARLVRAWAAMAATGDPRDGIALWPPLNASANGSALLIEGSARPDRGDAVLLVESDVDGAAARVASEGGATFRAAHEFLAGRCALFDRVFYERRVGTGVDVRGERAGAAGFRRAPAR